MPYTLTYVTPAAPPIGEGRHLRDSSRSVAILTCPHPLHVPRQPASGHLVCCLVKHYVTVYNQAFNKDRKAPGWNVSFNQDISLHLILGQNTVPVPCTPPHPGPITSRQSGVKPSMPSQQGGTEAVHRESVPNSNCTDHINMGKTLLISGRVHDAESQHILETLFVSQIVPKVNMFSSHCLSLR